MIPTYEQILDAVAKEFGVTVDIAERWIMQHVGANIVAAANE